MKERYLILLVLGSIALLLAAALLLPGREDHRPELLPWVIETHADGSSTVLGVHLGASTLADAERLLREEVELTLFKSPAGRIGVEGYFDSVNLSGLLGKLVVEVAANDSALDGMFVRGVRIAKLGDGSRKVSLHPDDEAALRVSPIVSLTYLPRSRLNEDLVRSRFGEPREKIAEQGGDSVHWLYPASGLDIALSNQGKAVLQYVAPRDFARLLAPLRAAQAQTDPGGAAD